MATGSPAHGRAVGFEADAAGDRAAGRVDNEWGRRQTGFDSDPVLVVEPLVK